MTNTKTIGIGLPKRRAVTKRRITNLVARLIGAHGHERFASPEALLEAYGVHVYRSETWRLASTIMPARDGFMAIAREGGSLDGAAEILCRWIAIGFGLARSIHAARAGRRLWHEMQRQSRGARELYALLADAGISRDELRGAIRTKADVRELFGIGAEAVAS